MKNEELSKKEKSIIKFQYYGAKISIGLFAIMLGAVIIAIIFGLFEIIYEKYTYYCSEFVINLVMYLTIVSLSVCGLGILIIAIKTKINEKEFIKIFKNTKSKYESIKTNDIGQLTYINGRLSKNTVATLIGGMDVTKDAIKILENQKQNAKALMEYYEIKRYDILAKIPMYIAIIMVVSFLAICLYKYPNSKKMMLENRNQTISQVKNIMNDIKNTTVKENEYGAGNKPFSYYLEINNSNIRCNLALDAEGKIYEVNYYYDIDNIEIITEEELFEIENNMNTIQNKLRTIKKCFNNRGLTELSIDFSDEMKEAILKSEINTEGYSEKTYKDTSDGKISIFESFKYSKNYGYSISYSFSELKEYERIKNMEE